MSNKSISNPEQGCDRIYHYAKHEDPSWFGLWMIVQKPIPTTEYML